MTHPAGISFVRSTGHTGFRDDKFYRYTPTTVAVMAGWPRMLAWHKTKKQPSWRMFRPNCGKPSLFDLTPCGVICQSSGTPERGIHCQRNDGDCVAIHDAWARWSQLIPLDVREQVNRYGERHWHLLSLAARCGNPAIDLMNSNPPLAWALASSWVFRDKPVQEPMRAARRLLGPGKSQCDILAWLGFPSSDSARKLIRKLRIASVNVNTLLSLRDAMRDPTARKFMAHLPELNSGVVRLLSDPELRPFCTANFLVDVLNDTKKSGMPDDVIHHRGTEDTYAHAAMTLRDCLTMLDFRDIDRATFRPIRSIVDLEERHEGLILAQRHAYRFEGSIHEPLVLPPPPLIGTSTIEPLTTEDALGNEGDIMHHCIGSYGARIASGELAVYQVLAPERATVAIGRKQGVWRIIEMRLACNKVPAKQTFSAVKKWLHESQK